MAEFLIFLRSGTKKTPGLGSWLDDGEYENLQLRLSLDSKLSTAERQKKLAKLQETYEGRSQIGDIVEVRPDGYWEKRGFDKAVYAVLKVPGLDPKQIPAGSVMGHTDDPDNDPPRLLRRFRYNISALNLQLGEIKVITKTKDVLDKLVDKVTNG